FLGQVLAGDADAQAAVNQFAIDAVVVLAPGQTAGGLALDGLADQAAGTGELQRVAADEIAGGIGFVELLAPQAEHGGAIAVYTFVYISADLRPWVEHQVPADEAAGVGETVGEAG